MGIEKMISVIMPTYNRAYIIERAIRSVLSQSYSNFELIIVDDGSTDETKAIIENFQEERIRFICYTENKGACFARNLGMNNANGEYIAFLDSDNRWDTTYLENRIRVFENEGKEIGLVWGRVKISKNREEYVFPDDEQVAKIKTKQTYENLIPMMLLDNMIDTNAAMITRACVERVGGFCERLGRLQDWEFFFRVIVNSGYKSIFADDCLANNYVLKDSISDEKNDMAYWQSKKFFLERYKDFYEKYNYEKEVYRYLFEKEQPKLTMDAIRILLEENEQNIAYDTILHLNALNISLKKDIEQLNKVNMDNLNYHKLHTKEETIINVLYKMFLMKQRHINIKQTLSELGMKKISIYGLGKIGTVLCNELLDSDCKLSVILDKNSGREYRAIRVISPDAYMDDDDVVIVTVVDEFEEIKKEYEKDVPFISINALIERIEKGGVNK